MITPNPDTLHFMAFFDTRDGPVVLDVPPAEGGAINDTIVTAWQMPLEDVGLRGVDRGAGGKFVILPPGYSDPVPEGYAPLRSDTFGSYALLRSNLASHGDADVAKSRAYGKEVKVYPLAEAANPPPTVFVDAANVLFDSTIRCDATFFDHLNRIVQTEPWIDRDQLKTLGIEKGKAFKPDAGTRHLLDAAALEAKALLEAEYDAGRPACFEGGHWRPASVAEFIEGVQSGYAQPDSYGPLTSAG